MVTVDDGGERGVWRGEEGRGEREGRWMVSDQDVREGVSPIGSLTQSYRK